MNSCIWIHYARPRPHWYSLDDGARTARMAQWKAAAESSTASGGACLGCYHVRGQHDFETVEIWRFPTPEAAFQHWSSLTAAGYGEYNAFANNVGISTEALP